MSRSESKALYDNLVDQVDTCTSRMGPVWSVSKVDSGSMNFKRRRGASIFIDLFDIDDTWSVAIEVDDLVAAYCNRTRGTTILLMNNIMSVWSLATSGLPIIAASLTA